MLQKFKVPGPAGTSLAGRPAVLTVSRNGPQQDAGAKARAGKQAFPEGLRSRARARSEGLRAVLLHVVTVPSSRFCSPQCGAAFQEDDVIVLNGTKEDVAMLQTRMEERRLRAKLGKVPEPWGLSLTCSSLGESKVFRCCPAAAPAQRPTTHLPPRGLQRLGPFL